MTVSVLVKLPDDVYRALIPIAAMHDTQVHHLIEVSITKSVRRPPRKGRRLTEEQLATIRRMNAEGSSDAAIARALGVAQSTVSRRRGDMDLVSPTPRAGGRQKAVSP